MMFSRKRQKAAAPRIAVVERLDPRLILDAPLMLASDGLVLADPTPDELLEPAVFEEAEPAATVPPSDESDGPDDLEPLPKVDAKSDAKSGPTVPMTTMSSGTLGTATLSVLPMGGVNEAGSPSTNTFRFRGESCGATSAPSSITVFYTLGGTAEPDVDFEGAITSGYLTIPMSGTQTNKSGDVFVGFSVRQDQIDEVTETLWVDVSSVSSDTGAPVTVLPPYSEPASITDDDIEWAEGDPIEGTITSSAGENPTIPINHTLDLSVSATDRDRKKDGGVWTDYWDDVTSGNTASDHHVSWTVSEGKLIQNGVEVTTAYGTNVTYLAPDYVEGPLERDVTITATVDDFNRGDDTLGFNDNQILVRRTLKVWQIKVTVSQDANRSLSANYDGEDIPREFGGGKLGWVAPNNPGGTEGYFAGTEIKATVPVPGRPTGWAFYQQKMGTGGYKQGGVWTYPAAQNYANWVRDIDPTTGAYRDEDTRHPNGPEPGAQGPAGPDVGEAFLFDAPGQDGIGVNNNGFIAAGTTDIVRDMQYRTWVQLGAVRVSNREPWGMSFHLQAQQNGTWTALNHSP